MTWYLGITTTRHIPAFPGAEKERGEFAVARQLRSLGIEAFAPQKIEFKRQGKKRNAEPIVSPYLPGYIFAEIPAAKFSRAIECRGLSRTLMAIPGKAVVKYVRPFICKVEDENAEARRIVECQDKAAMIEFQPGEALEILRGPFSESIVSFTRMVQAAHELHPMIEFEAQMFGQAVKGLIDPLDVKGAA